MIFLFEDHPVLKEKVRRSFVNSSTADAFLENAAGVAADGEGIAWYADVGPTPIFSPKRMAIIESYLKEFYPEALI